MNSYKNKKTFNTIFKELHNLVNYKLEYGIFNNERAKILKIHTYGSPARHIPKRDIMIEPIKRDRRLLYNVLFKYIKNTDMTQKHCMYPVLNAFGRFIIDNTIKHFLEENGRGLLAPLKQNTIKRKKNNLILRDTYKLYNSLTSRVVKK